MKIPEFFKGDRKTQTTGAHKDREYYENLASTAQAAWHDLGHTNVRFYVDIYRTRPHYTHCVRSNLVNGLPPRMGP